MASCGIVNALFERSPPRMPPKNGWLKSPPSPLMSELLPGGPGQHASLGVRDASVHLTGRRLRLRVGGRPEQGDGEQTQARKDKLPHCAVSFRRGLRLQKHYETGGKVEDASILSAPRGRQR